MKQIVLCIAFLLCTNIFVAEAISDRNLSKTTLKDSDMIQFQPILIDRDYLSLQSQQFITKEISFLRVCEEASKFWQSDETRSARWEPRVEKYFNVSTYSKYESEQVIKDLNVNIAQADLNQVVNIITYESINEFTAELAIIGCVWFIMGIGVVASKGKFFIFDLLLTTVICVWFGIKNQMIKDNLEDFLVLKNSRLSEMVYGYNPNNNTNLPEHSDAIRLLE